MALKNRIENALDTVTLIATAALAAGAVVLICMLIYVLLYVAPVAARSISAAHTEVSAAKKITLYINNPYNISADIEIKCDWDYRTRTWGYLSTLYVPPKQTIAVAVPPPQKYCQLYPHIRWWPK